MNNTGWPISPLGELLSKNEKVLTIEPDKRYREVTIRLWGKGVLLRQIVDGNNFARAKRFQVSHGQFILSRIDARNGAMGIVPPELDGAVVTNDFPSFNVDRERLLPEFLGWLSRTSQFVDMCRTASEGTTNRVRLQEPRFLEINIPLPPLEVQRRIVCRIDRLTNRISEARHAMKQIATEWQAVLRSDFSRIIKDCPRDSLGKVAPIVRRSIGVRLGEEYPELGIRCFGKGTFHKPSLNYFEIGSKKIYRINPGDLIFSNVFAWEGAIAVAQPEDAGRCGSHRFITCVPEGGVIQAEFLCFYFLTPEGLGIIGKASPGGAGRNRTLGLEKLENIEVPIPSYGDQCRFVNLLYKVRAMQFIREGELVNTESFETSVLHRAFTGGL